MAFERGVRARSARLLITSLKYLRTTLYHPRDREHFNQKYNTRTPTLEHRYKMHLQYTEKFKSKSGNALNPYVVFETDTRFKKPTLQHQQVPIERVRRKDCPCTERDLKRAFRNHISRWAAQTCPEFDFHYASVRTYLDASSLTSTYSVFEFAVHCERRAGYYIASYYVTLISCIAFTLMLFTAEPLVSERFENLIALTLTATALKLYVSLLFSFVLFFFLDLDSRETINSQPQYTS